MCPGRVSRLDRPVPDVPPAVSAKMTVVITSISLDAVSLGSAHRCVHMSQ